MLKVTRTPGDAMELVTRDGTLIRIEIERIAGKHVVLAVKAPVTVQVRWATVKRAAPPPREATHG